MATSLGHLSPDSVIRPSPRAFSDQHRTTIFEFCDPAPSTTKFFRWFLKQGVNVNHQDEEGLLPLHHLCLRRDFLGRNGGEKISRYAVVPTSRFGKHLLKRTTVLWRYVSTMKQRNDKTIKMNNHYSDAEMKDFLRIIAEKGKLSKKSGDWPFGRIMSSELSQRSTRRTVTRCALVWFGHLPPVNRCATITTLQACYYCCLP